VRLPNFLVIGAPRSGTTMLHYSLGQHPEIFVSPNKETNFFLFDGIEGQPRGVAQRDLDLINYRAVTTLEDYAALFAGATDKHRAIGESSPSYLHSPEVVPRIKARIPKARLVAILRQPVEQALSLYKVQQGGSVPAEGLAEGFVEAMTAEQAQARGRGDGLAIIEYGLYHRHLAVFFEHFDRRQIKVVLLEELQRDSARVFAELFRFLGVDDSFQPDLSRRYNETGAARSATLHRVLYGSHGFKRWMRSVLPRPAAYHLARLQHRLLNANLNRSQSLPPALRPELTKRFYADDIGALERLLGRDLGIWRQ
jgi:Sulfotransferase family